jgi:hypothetical protein
VLGAGTKPEARFDVCHAISESNTVLYTDVGLSVRELWTLRPRHDVQPTKVGFLAWCDQQQTENRADNESSELACSAASKNRADKELGRLILLYGKVES